MENKYLLLKPYKSLDRPISKYEINYRMNKNKTKLHLSNVYIKHETCGHCYLCKKFGKKYKEYNEYKENGTDIGNCSVCWKIQHTDFMLKQIAKDLAAEYYDDVNNNEDLTHYKMELENFFHSWLYK